MKLRSTTSTNFSITLPINERMIAILANATKNAINLAIVGEMSVRLLITGRILSAIFPP
jgi:hypothetical protein